MKKVTMQRLFYLLTPYTFLHVLVVLKFQKFQKTFQALTSNLFFAVFEASKSDDENLEEEPRTDMYNINVCILYQWCHPRNFSNVRLIGVYFLKHLVTAFSALAMMVALIWWYVTLLRESELNTSSLYR